MAGSLVDGAFLQVDELTGMIVHQRVHAADDGRPIGQVFDHLHGPPAAVFLGQLGEHVPGQAELGQAALGVFDAPPYQQIDRDGGVGHVQRLVHQAQRA